MAERVEILGEMSEYTVKKYVRRSSVSDHTSVFWVCEWAKIESGNDWLTNRGTDMEILRVGT